MLLISLSAKKLNQIKIKEKLIDTNIVENAPPSIAFTTVALGCFRGIIADLLWLHSLSLQDQGKYFEMAQIASWITKLQPRFTGATTFLAWNMAYNISITYANPVDKWRWVENGINLLKNAIKIDISSPELYNELAWLYLNKIGGCSDSSNLYYKNQLALKINKIIGNNPNWKILASTPNTLDGLYKRIPQDHPFWTKFRKSGLNSILEIETRFKQTGQFDNHLAAAINDPANLSLLSNYLRVKWLYDDFYMRAKTIYAINKVFGPLDWKLYQAHAVYWEYMALEYSPNNHLYIKFIWLMLANAVQNGKLLAFDPNNTEVFTPAPNLDIIPTSSIYIENLYNRTEQQKQNLKDSYLTFLNDAVLAYYTSGDSDLALNYYTKLKKLFPDASKMPVDCRDFANNQLLQNIDFKNATSAMSEIQNHLKLSYLYSKRGNLKAANAQNNIAYYLYLKYHANNNNIPSYDSIRKNTRKETEDRRLQARD